jgi:hypothetical protein
LRLCQHTFLILVRTETCPATRSRLLPLAPSRTLRVFRACECDRVELLLLLHPLMLARKEISAATRSQPYPVEPSKASAVFKPCECRMCWRSLNLPCRSCFGAQGSFLQPDYVHGEWQLCRPPGSPYLVREILCWACFAVFFFSFSVPNGPESCRDLSDSQVSSIAAGSFTGLISLQSL